MIQFRTGDILASDTEAVVNTVNCEGYMGKGIAYQFKLRYPKNNEAYVEACKKGILRIGNVFPYKDDGKIIFNFPTKNKWREKSKYDYVKSGLIHLVSLLETSDVKSVSIPPLGCGNGGLDWPMVKEIILNSLLEISKRIDIIIYEPSKHIVTSNTVIKAPKLNTSHLLLMGIKLKLAKFSKLRMQKTAYLINYLSNQNYFRFEPRHFGPYAHSLEILSKDIKEYQLYYGFRTDQAYEHAKTVLISETILEKESNFLPFLHNAVRIVNSISNDKDLELITTILFLLEKNHGLSTQELITKIQEWSDYKSTTFSVQQILATTEELVNSHLVEKELYGLAPLHNRT